MLVLPRSRQPRNLAKIDRTSPFARDLKIAINGAHPRIRGRAHPGHQRSATISRNNARRSGASAGSGDSGSGWTCSRTPIDDRRRTRADGAVGAQVDRDWSPHGARRSRALRGGDPRLLRGGDAAAAHHARCLFLSFLNASFSSTSAL